ncbi:MAG: VOC family protein [Actinobacteria bacterium]|nr:MAG: VOC family protein [Actinomycetota bacterium]
MTSRFTEIIVDCRDPKALGEFWRQVLGYEVVDDSHGIVEIAASPTDWDAVRAGPMPPTIVFGPVPEPKTVKNRLHIDVNPIDSTQEAEVGRLIALGARRIDIGQGDVHWVVMADPEDNEFCVLKSLLDEG